MHTVNLVSRICSLLFKMQIGTKSILRNRSMKSDTNAKIKIRFHKTSVGLNQAAPLLISATIVAITKANYSKNSVWIELHLLIKRALIFHIRDATDIATTIIGTDFTKNHVRVWINESLSLIRFIGEICFNFSARAWKNQLRALERWKRHYWEFSSLL